MKKKILNIDDNDKLNPTAGIRNYGAGTEDGIPQDGEESDTKGDEHAGDFDDEEILPAEEEQDELPLEDEIEAYTKRHWV